MRKIFVFLVVVLFILTSCKKEDTPQKANLLFKSGFEGGVYIDETAYEDSEDYRFIRGTDNETGFSWPITILGASESALHYIDDDNYQAVFCELQTVIGHTGKQTRALYCRENYDLGVTQCPYEILNIKEGTKDSYVKYWIKIDGESLFKPYIWRAIFEYKTKDYAEGEGFRLIAFVYSDENGNPYWSFQGDKDPEHPIWEIDNRQVPVPLNKWFMTEFYWHWSEGEDGIVWWKVNGTLIGEHRGPTTRNSKPIDFIMFTQIYGNSNPKYQWVDDIEIWDGVPK